MLSLDAYDVTLDLQFFTEIEICILLLTFFVNRIVFALK